MYLIKIKPSAYKHITESNPYWYDITNNHPPIYGYTNSEGIARSFMNTRNPMYFELYRSDFVEDEFLEQRRIDIYSLISENGIEDIVMTILECEMVKSIGMRIMQGYTDIIMNKRPTRELYPVISKSLLTLGYGSFYETIRMGLTGRVKPNEYAIFRKELGWTLR